MLTEADKKVLEVMKEFGPGLASRATFVREIVRVREALELGAAWGLASKGYDATTAIALADWVNSGFQGDPPKFLLPTSVCEASDGGG